MWNALLASVSYVGFGLVALLYLPLMALLRLVTAPFDKTRRIPGRGLRIAAVVGSRCYPRWRMEVRDAPAIAPGTPYVVVANHESTLDILLLSRLPWEMKWIAKAAVFKIPLLGYLFRMAGDIPVHREDKNSGAGALKKAREYVDQGMPVMVFPEGTRSRDGKLLPFKAGAFKLAIEAGVPILPVAVYGTARGMPVGDPWIRPTRAAARVLPPISVKGLTEADVGPLMERVRTLLQDARDQLERELRPDLATEAEPDGERLPAES